MKILTLASLISAFIFTHFTNASAKANDEIVKSITIYEKEDSTPSYSPFISYVNQKNNGFAIITKTKYINFNQGVNNIAINNIPDTADYSSIVISELSDDKTIIEQKFRSYSEDSNIILANSVGKDVEVEQVAGDRIIYNRGTLLSYSPKLVLDQGDKVKVINNYLSVSVNTGSSGNDKKEQDNILEIAISSDSGNDEILEYSFETTGIYWDAKYNLFINKDNQNKEFGTLEAWANIYNNTEIEAKATKLQLIAGSPNKTVKNNYLAKSANMAPTAMMARAEIASDSASSAMQQSDFSEYYSYSISRPIDIEPTSLKKIKLFDKVEGVEVFRKYKYKAQFGNNVHSFIEFENSKENNLGMAIPKGNYRVYDLSADKSESLNFIGEDKILRLSDGDKAEIKTGKAFDITAERKQNQKEYDSKRRVGSYSIEVDFKNSKNEDVTIDVEENIYQRNWKISDSNIPYKKENANSVTFPVQVKANSSKKLEYSVEYSW